MNRIAGATILLAAIAAGAMWQRIPEPPAPRLSAAAAEPWVLPQPRRDKPEKAVAAITERNLWGTVIPAAQISLNEPEWRIVGVIRSGPERHVLISIDNKPTELLKVGDKLPGGSPILTIGDDQLCVLVNGKKRALRIYR